MTGNSGEAYLLLPFCSGVLGLLQGLRLKEFAHYDSSLKARQSWMVQEKKGPYRSRTYLYVTCLASCFSCHDNCWAAHSNEKWSTYFKELYSLLCGQKAEAPSWVTLLVSSSAVFGCAGKLRLPGYLGLGSLDKSVFYVTNLSQVKMLFLTLLVKYSTHQTNALICYVITWHRTRLTNLGKIVRRFSGVPVHFFNISWAPAGSSFHSLATGLISELSWWG